MESLTWDSDEEDMESLTWDSDGYMVPRRVLVENRALVSASDDTDHNAYTESESEQVYSDMPTTAGGSEISAADDETYVTVSDARDSRATEELHADEISTFAETEDTRATAELNSDEITTLAASDDPPESDDPFDDDDDDDGDALSDGAWDPFHLRNTPPEPDIDSSDLPDIDTSDLPSSDEDPWIQPGPEKYDTAKEVAELARYYASVKARLADADHVHLCIDLRSSNRLQKYCEITVVQSGGAEPFKGTICIKRFPDGEPVAAIAAWVVGKVDAFGLSGKVARVQADAGLREALVVLTQPSSSTSSS